MKILFTGHNADLYGASRSLLRLASRLVRDGNEIVVALPDDGPLISALKTTGVDVRILPDMAIAERKSFASWAGRLSLPAATLASKKSFVKLIREVKPDIVHTNSSVILSSGWAASSEKVPHIQHVREFYSDFGKLWPLYRWWLHRYASYVVCVSEAVAAQFENRNSVIVFHNGFPRDEFPPVKIECGLRFRARFGIPVDAPLAGVVGRIKLKRKGQETFIAAAALIHDRFPDARFAIIGSPFAGNEDHEKELRRFAGEHGISDRVIFCGECDDMGAAYSALDIVVLASGTPEPFGGVVIEAMANGRAVIGTDIGGTREQIANGTTGLLIPPDDPFAMSKAMARLFSDPKYREEMGDAGQQRFLQQFEFEPFYEKMTGLYRETLDWYSRPKKRDLK